jgi:hypothetical protein
MAQTTKTRLLAPINVEALCVGEGDKDWVDRRPSFRTIRNSEFLGQQLVVRKRIFDTTANLLKPGVHLHWALPDGLTHGSSTEGAGLQFPLVPNRWLVVRSWNAGKGKNWRLRCRSWIVESDTVTPTKDAAKVPPERQAQSSWPRLLSGSPQTAEFVFAGKPVDWVDFDASKPPSTDRIRLTAVGYGDPAYAAFYPACRWSLGFHDDLIVEKKNEKKDEVELEHVTLNYFVAGWYSSDDDDPLHQAIKNTKQDVFTTLDVFLREHGWTYPGLITSEERLAAKSTQEVEELKKRMPSGLICHGTVAGVSWGAKKNFTYRKSAKDKVEIAVGDTAVEALGALWSDEQGLDDQMVKLLEAFQYDLVGDLEAPGGNYVLEQKLHERGYLPITRGIRWDLIPKKRTEAGKAGEEKTPPVPGAIRVLLEKVNAQQGQINILKRQRDAARGQLYSTWYKRVLNRSAKKTDDSSLATQEAALRDEVGRLTAAIGALEEGAPKSEEATEGRPKSKEWQLLRESIAKFAPEFTLHAVEESRFWRPTDPVILLTGPACRRSSRHGEDGRYREDGRLLCRLTGQTITELQVSIGSNSKTFGPDDLKKWCTPFSVQRQEVDDLFLESLLLTPAAEKKDSHRAQAIASAILEKIGPGGAVPTVGTLAEDVRLWLTNVWKDASDPGKPEDLHYQSGNTTLNLMGSFPSAITLKTWEANPWIPLFLQWEASWTPGYQAIAQALDNWELNPAGTTFDMTSDPGKSKEFRYEGTALLTPGAIWTFGDRLRQYDLIHNLPKLKTLQTRMRSMDVLCQSLAGFTDNLLMRKAYLELRPLEPGSPPKISPVYDDVKEIDWVSPLTDHDFFPVRAGHLQLKRLRIVDAFGQFTDVTFSEIHLPPELEDPNAPGKSIRLEPRLAQPARLKIDWPPSVPTDAQPSPICGWILPNLLDAGLMIYDAQGHALGALQAVRRKSWERGVGVFRDAIEGFHLVGVPGDPSFSFGGRSAPRTDSDGQNDLLSDARVNPDLKAFVEGLLAINSQIGEAFADLLESISQAASGTGNGGNSEQNAGLALLIGKPLALVRASISLELDGGPARSQGWDESKRTLEEQTGGIAGLKIAIRLGDRRKWGDLWLGDDGLVGFFHRKDYAHFFPAFGLDGTPDGYIRYRETPTLSIDTPLELTLLMDPARGVAVTTGILPRQIFHLPDRDLAETLEHKQVIFYTGPVVGPKPEKAAPKIHMPRPSDLYGQWSWTHHSAVKVWQETAIADTQKEAGHFSDNGLAIAEGWLKLETAPLSLRVFTVKGQNPIAQAGANDGKQRPKQPDEFVVNKGETIILSWSISGADRIDLYQDKHLVFTSDQFPLPAQRVVEVTGATSFTLVAIARTDSPPAPQKAVSNEQRSTINVNIK